MKAIGKQYNELIARARELWREREADRLCDAKLMEQAASTIGEMRCKLDDYNQFRDENAKLRDMCSVLYQKYWDVEGDVFIDPDMGKLEEKLRELGIETWEAWE